MTITQTVWQQGLSATSTASAKFKVNDYPPGRRLLPSRHAVELAAGDRAEAQYRSLPVDVPRGTAALTVTLEHRGGHLDLGCSGPDGQFRGWSGVVKRAPEDRRSVILESAS